MAAAPRHARPPPRTHWAADQRWPVCHDQPRRCSVGGNHPRLHYSDRRRREPACRAPDRNCVASLGGRPYGKAPGRWLCPPVSRGHRPEWSRAALGPADQRSDHRRGPGDRRSGRRRAGSGRGRHADGPRSRRLAVGHRQPHRCAGISLLHHRAQRSARDRRQPRRCAAAAPADARQGPRHVERDSHDHDDSGRHAGPGHCDARADLAALSGATLPRYPGVSSRRPGVRDAGHWCRHHDQDGAVRDMRSTRLQDFHIADWLPAGIGLDDLIVALASLATLVMFFAMWQALRPNSAFERRLEQIVQRKETLRQSALVNRRSPHRRTPGGLMHEAVTRLNLLRSRHAAEARQMLARAGFRSQDAMVRYLFAQISLPFVFGALILMDTHALHLMPLPSQFAVLPSMAAVLFGFFAPKLYLRNAADKRAKQLQLALPDGLDLMVICAEAGLSLDATLVRVSRELGNTWPELAEEFAITAAELTFLQDRRMAFDNLNNRTDSDGVRGVVNTLQQTAKFGTPLAQSLRVLATEMRTARMTRAEEKAARLPALLTIPMMIFILPTLFIVLLGPAAINVMDTFKH